MEPRDYEIQALGENRISMDELLNLALHEDNVVFSQPASIYLRFRLAFQTRQCV